MVTIFMVHNGCEYSGYAVLGLFTERSLAEIFSKAADGVVEEWEANVPPEHWMTHEARLFAEKKDGKWQVKIQTYKFNASIGKVGVECDIGHYAGWEGPDPKTGKYTHGIAVATGQSEEQVRKLCADAFWGKVSFLSANDE